MESHGETRFFESAKNLKPHTEFGIQKALWKSGKDLSAEFSRQVLAKNKTGRLYIRVDKAGRRRKHVASAAGETPANRTGFYRKSRDFIVRTHKELVFGNTAEYSGFLERGTKRMAARPGLANAIKASERNILRNLTEDISGAL
jgi:hypothetical protein